MARIDIDDNKPAAVVSAADFKQDLDRGYCAIEFMPETETVLVDRRSHKSVTVTIAAVVLLRCMRCKFDVGDSKMTKDENGNERDAKVVIEQHVTNGEHPWPYSHFENPYGHVADTEIEGVEDYATYIGELTNG